jgi:hypothetical protein
MCSPTGSAGSRSSSIAASFSRQTSLDHAAILGLVPRGPDAGDRKALEQPVLVLDHGAERRDRRHHADRRAMLLDRVDLLDLQPHILPRIEIPRCIIGSVREDEQSIGAEALELGQHLVLEPCERGDHGGHARHADDDAECGEHAAPEIRANLRQRQDHGLPPEGDRPHQSSPPAAATCSSNRPAGSSAIGRSLAIRPSCRRTTRSQCAATSSSCVTITTV